MSDQPGPPSLSIALHSVVGAAVDAGSRTGLLSLVRSVTSADGSESVERIVVPFPSQRRPQDDGPDAA